MVETKLVPTETTDRPMLSVLQLQELKDSARSYCRRKKIPISNEHIFSGAVGVLGDAVVRSLKEQGKVAVLEGERLAPLIQQGLKIRDQICEQAELAQKMAEPLAMPEQLVSSSKQETRNFVLCSHPEACEEIISLYQQRVGFLAELAQTGLADLPVGLQGVGVDRFPDITDRAKLVRNMIASYVFRGNLNPLVTNDDLKEFAGAAKIRSSFIDNQLGSLVELLGQDKIEFLKAIFTQTAGLFKTSYSLPQEGDAESTDRFYRYFGNFLLLQHPALEEEQIVTRPDFLQAGRPSLWDGASSIKGVFVPTPEMLVRADRQEEARLNQVGVYRPNWESPNRFVAGIRVWRMFQDKIAEHPVEIRKLEVALQETELFLASLMADPSLPLPKRAYEIIYTRQARAMDEVTSAKMFVQTVESRRYELALEYQTAIDYRNDLNNRYSSVWPDQLPIPQEVLLQREQSQETYLRNLIRQRETRLVWIANLFNLDPLFNPTHPEILVNLSRPEAINWLVEEIAGTKVLLGSTDYLGHPQQFLQRIQERLRYGLRDLGMPEANSRIPQELQNFSNFWKDVYIGVRNRTKASVDYWESIWPEFTRDLLYRRIALMEMAQATLIDRFVLQEQLDGLKQVGAEEEVIFWSKDEAERYIQTAVASRFMRMPNPVPEEWLIEAHKMLRLIQLLKPQEDLPIIDHPIYPTRYSSLPRADFISVWRKRCQQVLLIEELKGAKNELDKAEENFQGVCRATFIIRLTQEIKSLQSRLELVKQRDPEVSFIEQMRDLNLVLEEKAEEDIE